MKKEFRETPGIRSTDFSVHTFSMLNKDDHRMYVHWAEGLNMVIRKGGQTIKLNADEIQDAGS